MIRQRFSLAVKRGTQGAKVLILEDLTRKVRDLSFTTSRNGMEACTGTISTQSLNEAFTWYAAKEILHLELYNGGEVIWEGRIEDIAVLQDGVRFTAYGYWRAYSDLVENSFWSSNNFDGWEELRTSRWDLLVPDAYETTIDETLIQISPKKGEVYWSQQAVGIFVRDGNFTGVEYMLLHKSRRDLANVQFGYSLNLPEKWKISLLYSTREWIADGPQDAEILWELESTGSPVTGFEDIDIPVDVDIAQREFLFFYVEYNDPVPTEYAGETGESYFRIGGISLHTDEGDPITAMDVVRRMVTIANDTNPSQFHWSLADVEVDDTNDLTNLTLEDMPFNEVIKAMAETGNGLNQYEYGVGLGKRLFIREKDSTATLWIVEVNYLELERLVSTLYNRLYGVYEQDGDKLRTDKITDSTSVAFHDLLRETSFEVPTYGEELNLDQVNDELAQRANPIPRARIGLSRLFNRYGGEYGKWHIKAGDLIQIRNLMPTVMTTVGEDVNFRIAMTTYNVIEDTVEVELEVPMPSIVNLLAFALVPTFNG